MEEFDDGTEVLVDGTDPTLRTDDLAGQNCLVISSASIGYFLY